jgi:hypothetical protein
MDFKTLLEEKFDRVEVLNGKQNRYLVYHNGSRLEVKFKFSPRGKLYVTLSKVNDRKTKESLTLPPNKQTDDEIAKAIIRLYNRLDFWNRYSQQNVLTYLDCGLQFEFAERLFRNPTEVLLPLLVEFSKDKREKVDLCLHGKWLIRLQKKNSKVVAIVIGENGEEVFKYVYSP